MRRKRSLVFRSSILLYGLVSYTLAMAAILYLIGFLAGFDLPTLADPGMAALPAVLVNIGLIALFGGQHSIMAREGFKRRLRGILPPEAERMTYVLAAALVSFVVLLLWQPLPAMIWRIDNGLLRHIVVAVFWFGFGLAIVSTFVINHFDLFGLRQTWLAWRQRPYTPVAFQQPWLYRLVRHPMMSGLLLAFWATPEMTLGRLIFAAGMSLYILIGLRFEERDMARRLGPAYETYRQNTPALVPRFNIDNAATAATSPGAHPGDSAARR